MIAYHGSGTNGIKKLSYTEAQSRFGGEQGLVHGAAIYLTVSELEAQAYATSGSYYKVEISAEVFDSTEEESLQDFIRAFETKHNIDLDLSSHESFQELIKHTISGKSSGVVFARNIFSIISNDFGLYSQIIQEVFNEDSDACLDSLTELFNYSFIKLNNSDTQTWILCLDKEGTGIEILEEITL